MIRPVSENIISVRRYPEVFFGNELEYMISKECSHEQDKK